MQKPTSQSNGALPPPVAVRELRKVYRDIAAVDGISFDLATGSITALLGGNGAGKTTTISMLMGLVVPTSGEARVFGADMAREHHKVLHRMNFESPYVDVPMRLTVRQNLEIFARLYGVRDLKGRIAETAGEFKLSELLDRPYGKLSAGQKTRVSPKASVIFTRPKQAVGDLLPHVVVDVLVVAVDQGQADHVAPGLIEIVVDRVRTAVEKSATVAAG
jgi:ABC-type Na+ transport system ATPase subunit NatA